MLKLQSNNTNIKIISIAFNLKNIDIEIKLLIRVYYKQNLYLVHLTLTF